MSDGWQVIDLLDYQGFIGYSRGNLDLKGQLVPLANVSCVLIGQKVNWGYGLVAAAERFDVQVLVCDWRRVPIGVLLHTSSNSRVGARQRAQANLTEPRRKNAWMQIVKAKIRGQAQICSDAGALPAAQSLMALAASVKSGDPYNAEARAARIYWTAFSPGFSRDNTKSDFINSALNYGYTILRGRVITEISAAGLSPTLGIFHHHRGNPFALADDLIEPFRPAVDHSVRQMSQRCQDEFSQENRKELASVAESMAGHGIRVRTAIANLAQQFARYIEGDIKTLTVEAWALR